jgi:glycosyltransferase involved in cell wall biosynthesis
MLVAEESRFMFPTISIIIPTLNSAKTLRDCLKSIAMQEYSEDKIEIIIADGGSTDKTLAIINDFDIKVVSNPLKTGEAGKAAGLRYAKNDIIALIDSDNILPDKDWLKRMTEPFEDLEIIASEPIEYTYRKTDGYITRYCALLGMNDPLCLFLGNYDRYSALTGKWTDLPVSVEERGRYLKVALNPAMMPTIGANGFLIRRDVLKTIDIGDYFFDIDILSLINSSAPLKIAKVKNGIIHIFSGNISTFARKQRRRVRDYLYYDKLHIRKYQWGRVNKIGLAKFIFSCLFFIPLLFQSINGYLKKPDIAWFFHPAACWITLWEYGWGRIGGIFGVMELKRDGWRQ